MGELITNRIDFGSIPANKRPRVGSFIIGLDLADDVYKKMDSNGTITIIGGSGSGSTSPYELDSNGTGILPVTGTNISTASYSVVRGGSGNTINTNIQNSTRADISNIWKI